MSACHTADIFFAKNYAFETGSNKLAFFIGLA